ncbi:MAG: hypothetical protein NWF01_06815 [Candidatus Bathyarchaeota archaeon]|nr:hypothetical protein [Candidatus Bathyarchaeota archaeon]
MAVLAFFSATVALVAGFVFTFLVPGVTFHRFFNLKQYELWAFIPVFSILVSVTLIYFASLIFGYSPTTILGCFLALTVLYAVVVAFKGESFTPKKIIQIKNFSKVTLTVFLIIFVLSFYVLYSSVWVQTDTGLIISGSNWQDTPYHYGIIESLNQGNFPPQFPNYAGVKMTYHYFVDFHTAILENVYGYLPKLLPTLNAVFILVFALSMYALAREFGRKAALIATVVGVFGCGFSYVNLFSALFQGQFVASQNYFFQYAGTFGLPPIFDNLLQQRPMLIGLPVFALVLMLLRNPASRRRLLLAGILTGLVFEFHNVAFFCCGLAFLLMFALNFKQSRFSKNYLYFLVPCALALPFIFQGGTPASINVASEWISNFSKNPFTFLFLNLGIPVIIAFISLTKRGNNLLKTTFVTLILVPYIVQLTPNAWDMYKFYLFAWVPIAVLMGWFLTSTKNSTTSSISVSIKPSRVPRKFVRAGKNIAVLTLVVLSVLSSISVVTFNLGANYQVATTNELQLGMWVRENTTQNSVFLTYPNYGIYSPPAYIGGRITVSSYINWPYGHGIPLEQIQQRESDIDRAYGGSEADLQEVVSKYNVSYIYVGFEELAAYWNCTSRFNSISWLQNVYSDGQLQIYKVTSSS